MDPDRRSFLASGLAAGLGGVLFAGRTVADDIEEEVRKRTRYLSPPDGIPADAKFGVPFRSPCARPFREPLFIPPTARPEICMSGPDWLGADGKCLPPADWWEKFLPLFRAKAEEYRKRWGVSIGDPPVPLAHQRFWEFCPKKFYILREREVPRRYHRDYGKKANCWTWCYDALCEDGCYHATSPGPTIRAHYGEPILVRRVNDLPEVANHAGGARVKFGLPSTTTHLHNAHSASESDGNPDDFINPGEYWDHHYGNFPSGFDDREKLTTLWHHDHRMDFTAANVYAGLDGFYLLHDEQDAADEAKGWKLPFGKDGKFDIPLILHDLLFKEGPGCRAQLAFDGYNSDGVLGDQFTVNRKIRPFLEVQPRKYRFRILNGGPSRFYELALFTRTDGDHPTTTPAPPFVVITGDGNFQPSPLVAGRIHLGVAQRVDVIVDFSEFSKGDEVYLVNQLRQIKGQGATGELIPRPDPKLGATPDDIKEFFHDYSVMRFQVVAPRDRDKDRSVIRLAYRPLPNVDLTEVVRERVWDFDHDGGLWTVNGRVFDSNRIDAGIEEHTAEIWTLRNSGNGWQHPIHSHFTEFIALEIDGRPQYQTDVQTGEITHRGGSFQKTLIDSRDLRRMYRQRLPKSTPMKDFSPGLRKTLGLRLAKPPDEDRAEATAVEHLEKQVALVVKYYEDMEFASVKLLVAALGDIKTGTGADLKVDRFLGGPRRDIALLFPGTEMKVFMRWRDFRGKYVMHCHNVVHEDHAMMVRWDITPRGRGFDTPKRANPSPGRPYAEPHPAQTNAQDETKR